MTLHTFQHDEDAGQCDTIDLHDDWQCPNQAEWRATVGLSRKPVPLSLCTEHLVERLIETGARFTQEAAP